MTNEEFIYSLGHTIALDLETTGLDPHKDTILGFAITDGKSSRYFREDGILCLNLIGRRRVVFQNFKFDLKFLAEYGIKPHGWVIDDTLVQHHLLDENKDHDLTTIISDVLHINTAYKEVFWAKYDNAIDAPEAELAEYAIKDVVHTLNAYVAMTMMLLEQRKERLYRHVMNLAMELFITERDGICVDLPYLMAMGEKLQNRIQANAITMRNLVDAECSQWELDNWVKEMDKRKTDKGKAGVPKPTFSFASNKQLGELLYDCLGLPEQLSKTKSRTVDDAALGVLESKHPLIPVIRDEREAQKIYGTYIKGVLERMVGDRIFPTFNVCGTVTGRISHQNPNMGNMPRDGGLRGMFIPSAGHNLISADYSQLEICLAAHFSEDPTLIDLVRTGKSMHDMTAQALGKDRNTCKTLNFAVLYGAAEYKVMHIFGCSQGEAQHILKTLFAAYPGLKNIIDKCHKLVEDDLPIVNPFGRTRSFKGQWNGKRELERCKRQAFNALIQGTGGDLTNRAFYLIAADMREQGIGRALFTVHDEVIVEARTENVQLAKEIITKRMLQVGEEISLRVPLAVAVSDAMQRWED